MRFLIFIGALVSVAPAFGQDSGGVYLEGCDWLLQAQADEAAPAEEYGPGVGLGVELFASQSLPKRQDQPPREVPPAPYEQDQQQQQ